MFTRKKKLRQGEVSDEEKRELAGYFGSDGDGVTVVDSREYTYDSQVGWQG